MNVVITGGNRGIGLALATAYAERGDRVWVVCRRTSDALDKLTATAKVTIVSGVDVAQATMPSLRNLIGADITIDLLINNAGIGIVQDAGALESNSFEEEIAAQLNVNVVGTMRATRSLLPSLKPGSKIVMISSQLGSIADNKTGANYGYRASKAALNAVSVSLAKDLASRGILVGILHPGFVQTDMTRGNGDMTTESCAKLLAQRITELDTKTSGKFINYNGDQLRW